MTDQFFRRALLATALVNVGRRPERGRDGRLERHAPRHWRLGCLPQALADGGRVSRCQPEFDRLFSSRHREVADLRALGGPALVGDCNRNGVVAIDELVRGVNIALGGAPLSECPPFDRVADGRVTVDELVCGAANALR